MSQSSPELAFYLQLEAEVSEHNRLDANHYERLSRYYKSLKSDLEMRPFYRYNWTRRVAPMQEIIASLPKRDAPWRVLDAGCGLGTESIFWSILRDDIEVTGTDISPARVGVAKARQTAYEKHIGRTLNLCFLEQDVFTLLKTERFDLVWVMEAISHIDPAEKFLADASDNLDDSGHLVISDSHIWNPAMAWRVLRLRRRGVTPRTQKTTSDGQTVSYAQERLLTVGWLSSILKEVGFASVQTQLSVFFPPKLAASPSLFSACKLFDRIMNRVPAVRNLGGIYTLVASK
jgi:2-polyprenyl-3-methyl-5-hydroxy-6-metoxy-1,4-benzoquinol methylase